MSTRRSTVVALAVVAALGTSVGGSRAGQLTPGTDPAEPALTVVASSGSVRLSAVRACWAPAPGLSPLCFGDIPTGDEPLVTTASGGDLTLLFATASTPLTVAAHRVVPGQGVVQSIELAPTNPARLVAAFPPGIHRVDVVTTWAQGTAHFIFRTEVTAAPAPTTTAVPVTVAAGRLADSGGPVAAAQIWGVALALLGLALGAGVGALAGAPHLAGPGLFRRPGTGVHLDGG